MAPLVGDAAGDGDVLVARATPVGTGALAIVRLSGPAGRVLALAREMAPRIPARPQARRAYLSPFLDEEGSVADEGLVLWFASPASSTGEEVVELQAHGSPAVVELLVASAVSRGARRARPGEFTRRALANGKIDLARAEGIGLLAGAASRGEARRALGLVRGELSRKVAALREELLGVLVELEARLDFAEDVERDGETSALARIVSARAALRLLASEAGAGRAPGVVPTVVIVGAPNAGKSTLFNALLGEDRALVTELAGTTRDAVAEMFEVEGERVRLVDTAGLRETTERLERLGVEAAGRAAAGADLLLVAREAGGESPARGDLPEGVPVLVLETKADLPGERRDGELRVSARTGEGLTALRREIGARLVSCLGTGEFGGLPRQREALLSAAAALDGLGAEGPAEIAAGAVRAGLHALGEITGETATEELLDRIFSTFCVGK
ncbi:MAG: tRNA modification GTPase [Holophagales bacterium]|nr:tRNA modification GTPase [Holophagales bacterium]